ncbi:MAG TPA: TonB-dependent receptor [Ideonella sp.]|nr:TonB-dependent receptor [Ideonella sp.]
MAVGACGLAGAQQGPAPPDAAASAPDAQRVLIRGQRPIDIGPLPGLAITKDQLPANVQSATKDEIRDSRALNIGDYMNKNMQGVNINDYAGNPFQMDVNYRGFTASPQIGTPQGLSVFFDGVRVNESFGDVVNWDLIPLNAIERFDLFPGSNPIFGLNTLGGAIAVHSKSGFSAPGVEASVLGGSSGRRQVQLSGGANDEGLAGFAALSLFHEDGWRDDSPSRMAQFFGRGDLSVPSGTLTATVLAANNTLVGNGLIPVELYRQRPESVYTSADESKNKLLQLTVSGTVDVSDTMSITGRVYRRASNRRGFNGDVYEGFEDMGITYDKVPAPPGSDAVVVGRNGAADPFSTGRGVVAGTPIGLLSRTDLDQTTVGAAGQLNWNLKTRAFMLGASVDRNSTRYELTQRLGLINAAHGVYADPDAIADQYYAAANDVPGNNFSGHSTTASLYFSDTWTPQPEFTLTSSARYNFTRVSNHLLVRSSEGNVALHELRVNNKNIDKYVFTSSITEESFDYRSFNPALGLNWRPAGGLNVFANLSRGARVPSVVELGCAFDDTPVPLDPNHPEGGTIARSLRGPGCNLPTTLSADPYLPQIRAISGELGARGQFSLASATLQWNLSLFRTDLHDDIYYVGVADGRSFFDTIGKTRRQGVEMGLKASTGPLDLSVDYTYTDATFQSAFYVTSPHNSSADFDQNSRGIANSGMVYLPSPTAGDNNGLGTYRTILVQPGDRMPGIPSHTLNLQSRWRINEALRLALGMQLRSSTYVRGNENNGHRPSGSDQETGLFSCQPAQCATTGYQQDLVPVGRPFNNSGRLGGYAVFNLDASYQINRRTSVFLQVTNLFDRRYASAGRLGVNPFSPAVNGAVGPSGWNYNSSEWQNSSFVGPGAPRGIFIGLSYDFDARP